MFQFSLIDSIAMFFIYAFVGWIVEVIYYGINEGKFVNRGFLNGPLCPVYGFGFYGVIVALTPVEDNFPMLFFGSMLITTVVEFLAGFILYKAFELRWWDYRDRKFNVLGFICLRFSIYWGIACSLAMKMLHPTVMFILEKCPFIIKIIALAVCAVLLVFDLFETIIAVIGFKKKIKVITDITGEIKSVSDKIGSKIYGQVENVVQISAPTVSGYEEYKKLFREHRDAERNLIKSNYQEEKALLDRILKQEKDVIKSSRDATNTKLLEAIATLHKREERISARIRSGGDERLTSVLEFIKRQRENER